MHCHPPLQFHLWTFIPESVCFPKSCVSVYNSSICIGQNVETMWVPPHGWIAKHWPMQTTEHKTRQPCRWSQRLCWVNKSNAHRFRAPYSCLWCPELPAAGGGEVSGWHSLAVGDWERDPCLRSGFCVGGHVLCLSWHHPECDDIVSRFARCHWRGVEYVAPKCHLGIRIALNWRRWRKTHRIKALCLWICLKGDRSMCNQYR